MSTYQDALQTEPTDSPFDPLSDETRLQILRILRGCAGAIPTKDLAERLATKGASPDSNSTDASAETVESLRIRLHHIHLPKLVECGLVSWDEDERMVSGIDLPAQDAQQQVERVVTEAGNSIGAVLADDRQRAVIASIKGESAPVHREDLASELASLEADGQPEDSLHTKIEVQLHHRLLPKLEAAGLVDYDPDDGTVTYRGPTELPNDRIENIQYN